MGRIGKDAPQLEPKLAKPWGSSLPEVRISRMEGLQAIEGLKSLAKRPLDIDSAEVWDRMTWLQRYETVYMYYYLLGSDNKES